MMAENAASTAVVPEAPAESPQESTRVEAEPQDSPHESDYESDGSTGPRSGDSESDGSVGLERQSGDGQESQPTKRVDDDEDKKNPQYIPKRGTFYEHDDRMAEEEADEAVVENEKEKDPKKKVWQDKREKWSHDKFNDSEQAPKSRAELVAIYGYDIRNEDGPPRARRRRRYGRGPNKYTRNWEDEDAYGKPAPVRPKKPLPKRQGRGEDYPSLTPTTQALNERNRERQREDNYEQQDNGNNGELPQQQQYVPQHQQQQQQPQQHYSGGVENQRNQQRVGSGRVIKPKREIKDSDYRGFTAKTRQVRNVRTEQKVLPKRKEDVIQTQNFTNKNSAQDLEKEMSKLSVQESQMKGPKGGQRQGSVPPRLQSESKTSKRYSSIRQRSLPESGTPPFNQPQHSNYYSNEFNQNQVNIHPSTTQVPQIAPPPLPPIPAVTAAPILQPPQFATPFAPQAPPFLQAAPPFIPTQQPQIINYVPSQPQFPQGYQGYQQQFNQNQPELFQPQGGITYYSADQQVAQRPTAPPKRPKAAIPIVAPPPLGLKGKMKEDEMTPYEGDISATSEGQTEDSSGQESISQVQQ